jgi:SAM-dependent methyltransferase
MIVGEVMIMTDDIASTHANHAGARDEHSHSDHESASRFMDEAFWDERYGSIDKLWSGNPNPQLVSEVSDLSPGTALDAGCGEGADAIWLAEHGWRVTAVDFSRVALERGSARALQVGAEVAERITWIHADLTTWIPASQSFGLVSAHFMHFPREQREPLYRRLAASVAPAGTLLIVAHHPSDLQTTVQRPRLADMFFTGDDLAAELELDSHQWDIVTNAAPGRTTTDPDGRAVTIRDTVLRARRRLL